MPTTATFGIVTPCGPAIDVDDFATYALGVDDALAEVNAPIPALLTRDFVLAQGTAPVLASGVTSTVIFNDPGLANNPNGMWNSASPTLFTLSSSGSYLAKVNCLTFGYTTQTSVRGAILLAGAERVWEKIGGPIDSFNEFTVSGHILSATAGQQVTVTVLFTGTGTPTPSFSFAMCKISDV